MLRFILGFQAIISGLPEAQLKPINSALHYRRRLIGETIEELRIQRSGNVADTVQEIPSGKIGPGDGGGLSITVPDTGDNVLFAKEGNGDFRKLEIHANVGIKTNEPGTALEVSKDYTDAVIRAQTATSGNSLLSLLNNGNQEYQIVANRTSNRLEITRSGMVDAMMAFDPNNGSVGIGTTNPAGHQLDIASSQGATGNSAIRALYPGGGDLLNTEFAALAHRGDAWTALYARQGAAASAAYFDGNVGIGTQNSQTALHIERNDAVSTQSIILYNPNTAWGSETLIKAYSDRDDPNRVATAFGHYRGQTSDAGSGFIVKTGTRDSLTTKFIINNSGNVGIGTLSPNAKLEVAGDVRVLSDALRFDNSWNPNPSYRGTTFTTRATLLTPANGNSSISIHSESGQTALVTDGPIMSLESGAYFAGNVGIGNDPSYKLDVNGDIRAIGTVLWGGNASRTEVKNDAGAIASKSGFFDTDNPVNYYSGAASWQHLIESRHRNDANNYALQIAGSFFDQELYFRKTNSSSTTPWNKFIYQNREGNVGIGTTTPGAKLDISGSGGASQCCAPVLPTISLAEASNTAGRQAWLQFHNAGEAEAYIGLAGGGPPGSGREGQRRLEIGDNQGVRTSLTVTGDIVIAGKHAFRGNDSWLRLNQDNAFTSGVHTPGVFAPGSLNVGGAAGWGNPGGGNVWITGNVGIGTTSIDSKLEVAGGDIHMEGGRTFYSHGRMHIHGDEILFLLNKSGVNISQAGGGNGNLIVEGNVGIGRENPEVKVHVLGNRIRLQKDWGPYIDIRADGDAFDIETVTQNLFINNNDRIVYIKSLSQ